MGDLPRQLNHGGAGVKHNGVAGFHQRCRRTGDSLLLKRTALGFLQRRRLGRNKPVQRHPAVRSADHPFLIEFDQVAANGGRRGVGRRHQLVDCHQIMAFQEVHNLL